VPTLTGASANIVGSSETGGIGAGPPGDALDITIDDPTWICVIDIVDGDGAAGRGTRNAFTMY
jgi:hypothetical protein